LDLYKPGQYHVSYRHEFKGITKKGTFITEMKHPQYSRKKCLYYRNTGSKDIRNSSSSNFKSSCFSNSLNEVRVPGIELQQHINIII